MGDEVLLSKKVFIGIFIVLTVVAIGVAGYSQFNLQTKESPSPSPEASGDLLFGDPPSPQASQQQTPQKQIKQYPNFPGELQKAELTNKKAVIETQKGTIEFEIFPDAPKAASNFIFLATDKFYDGLTFHRVENGFVIQGGDPFGNGTGGPGYKFEDEKVTKKYKKGIVAMANAGQNTNGSQFFIMLEDNEDLPPNYTIFGKVIKGQEVVAIIQKGEVMTKVTIEPLK